MSESGLAAKARRCAREDHRAASQRHEPARSFPSHEESSDGSRAHEAFKFVQCQLAKIDAPVVADVIDDKRRRFDSIARSHGFVEEIEDVLLRRCIGYD